MCVLQGPENTRLGSVSGAIGPTSFPYFVFIEVGMPTLFQEESVRKRCFNCFQVFFSFLPAMAPLLRTEEG